MENLPDLVVPFKREAYERVVKEFAKFTVKAQRPTPKPASLMRLLVHRRALQVLIECLEVIEPRDPLSSTEPGSVSSCSAS